MAKELDIGRWTMRFALYGDEAVVDHSFAKIKDAFERIPGADVYGAKCAPEDIPQLEHPVERVQGGVPTMDLNQMTAWYGGEEGGHIGFSPVAPLTGPDAIALRDLLRGMIESAGLDYMAALIPINARSFIHVTLIIFDTKNEAQTRAAYDVASGLVRDAAKLGYGEYRAHLDFMDLAAEQYGFNDHAYRRFNERIKDVRSTRTASSRPASPGSGRRRCGRARPALRHTAPTLLHVQRRQAFSSQPGIHQFLSPSSCITRRHQDHPDDRGVEEDRRGQPDPEQLQEHVRRRQEGEEDDHHDRRRGDHARSSPDRRRWPGGCRRP